MTVMHVMHATISAVARDTVWSLCNCVYCGETRSKTNQVFWSGSGFWFVFSYSRARWTCGSAVRLPPPGALPSSSFGLAAGCGAQALEAAVLVHQDLLAKDSLVVVELGVQSLCNYQCADWHNAKAAQSWLFDNTS